MINIPTKFKNALMSGNYRKEYKFSYPVPPSLHTFTEDSERFYFLDAFESKHKDPDTGEWIYDHNDFYDNYSEPVTIHAVSKEPKKFYFNIVYHSSGKEVTVKAENGGEIVFTLEEASCDMYIYYKSPDVNVATPVRIYIDGQVGEEVITNDRLIKESVKIDERMCSAETIKFGLCEGSSLEFQCFDVDSIKGKTLKCEIVVYSSDNESYTIPMGTYTVDSVSRQASTGIYKVTAFNKLKSKYLDAKANRVLISNFDNPNTTISVYDIEDIMLDDYQIERNTVGKVTPTYDYGVGYVRKLGGGTIKLKAKYGIDSPLNYWQYSAKGNTTDTGYLFVVASESKCTLSPTTPYKIKFTTDIEELEDLYFQRICDLGVQSFNVTREQFITRLMTVQSTSATNYKSYLGWHNYFGVKITYNDGTVKYYSKYAYQYGLANVAGTLKDLANTSVLGATQIEFCIPYNLALGQDGTGGMAGNYVWVNFYESKTYSYYTSSNLQGTASGTYSWEINGHVIDYKWIENGWYELYGYELFDAEKIQINVSQIADFSLRDIVSAVYETECVFGKLSRTEDKFTAFSLNPSNVALYVDKNMYSQLWIDEFNILSWKYLIITYQGTDGNEHTTQRTINPDGKVNYNCSDNWLFRNLQWTESQIGVYADKMAAKMASVTWIPLELWCAGLPYLETGDTINFYIKSENYKSYILQRNLDGIQDLHDTYINGELDIF